LHQPISGPTAPALLSMSVATLLLLATIAVTIWNAGGHPVSIDNRRQLENTRNKLQELEQQYAKAEQAASANEHVRELTLRSLKGRINQFKEEIARFEARVSQATPNG
jgi:type VI protein secretion system component VasK